MDEKEQLYQKFFKEAERMYHMDVLRHIYAMLKIDYYVKLEEKRNELINTLSQTL